MVELLRTNDLVLISVVQSLLDEAGVGLLVVDSYAASVDGSLGFLPRRLLVPEGRLDEARRLLVEAGLGGELPATRG